MPDRGTVSALDIAQETLALAQEHIRLRTRSATYFEHGDRFAAMFLGAPLGLSPEHWRSVGTDVAVILDTCYEQLTEHREGATTLLEETTRELGEMLDPSAAVRALPALGERLGARSCPLLSVACAVLASITTLGYASLSERGLGDVAGDWLSLWQSAAGRHNRQQERHTALCLVRGLSGSARDRAMTETGISPAEIRSRGTTFTLGAKEYLVGFSETAASTMALSGALPFARKLSDTDVAALIRFLAATPALLLIVSSLLRLAQDVKFDVTEPLSTGVAALAAEKGVSVLDIDARKVPVEEVEEKLRRVWTAHAQESREHLDEILSCLPPGEPMRRGLAEIVDTTYLVANALARAPHKAEDNAGARPGQRTDAAVAQSKSREP